jgi:c(7)-type cytochrome triheme protein
MSGPRRLLLAALALLPLAWPAPARDVVPPQRYGRVVLGSFTGKAKVPAVAFDHWRHRALFTCRLCHVDVGFAMTAGATKVSASTNRGGFHCGACHDGKTQVRGKVVFASCSESGRIDESPACRRCHAPSDPPRLLQDYQAFAEGLPRKGIAGGVDWEEAEATGKIRPLDFLEGTSIPRKPLKMEKEITIESRGAWMANVMFSHRKHAVWNGCEVCHPEIYPSTKSGSVKYSMFQIASGESCGVCHDRVAFPLADCERCHLAPVR